MSIRFIADKISDTALCEPQLNLLAHAQVIELDIGSRCGGHGVCGGDRVQIMDPRNRAELSRITENERKHLTQADLDDGWRLACQTFPSSTACKLDLAYLRKSQRTGEAD